MTAFALISDVHANLPALEAVAADIARRRPDAVYVLGDIVNGTVWPAEVLDYCLAAGWPMLMGNHDDAVLQLGTPRMEPRYADRQRYAQLWWTRARLTDGRLNTLAALPLECVAARGAAPPMRLVHGIPGNFFIGIRPESPERWVRRQIELRPERAIAGGHTHFPLVRELDGRLIVNSGSVGAPYDGDARAGYAWMEGDRSGWRAEIIRVDYDSSAVAAAYRASGLAREGGALAEMFHRTVMTGQPWVSDFAWWIRQQPVERVDDPGEALRYYDAEHGPGRWSFPLPVAE